jgi:hypothetical protein
MQTLNRSTCSTLAGLAYARLLEHHGLIDHFVKSALNAMELNVRFETIDEQLLSELFAVAEWYTSRGCFDRAEEIYLTVLDAQEAIWGPDSASGDETIDRIIELLAREQEERVTQGEADLSSLLDFIHPSLIIAEPTV